MAPLIRIEVSLRFEPFLALASEMAGRRCTGSATWLGVAHLVGDLMPSPAASPASLLAALRDMPAAAFTDQGGDKASILRELGDFLDPFWARWAAAAAAYQAAAARLEARLDPASDLGEALGFPMELELRRRGLRAPGQRLAPNRLAAIEICPSAFNADHFWHLGPIAGGRHVIHLPVHDATLADLMRVDAGGKRIATASAPQQIALLLRALGDQSRLAMAQLLARETLSAAELGRRLDLSAPAVSYHLGDLRKAGLIRERPVGASLQLSLEARAFEDLGDRILGYLRENPLPDQPGRSRRRARAKP
jgi:DNA-binding transcriptional ArsR family regulator